MTTNRLYDDNDEILKLIICSKIGMDNKNNRNLFELNIQCTIRITLEIEEI